MLRGLRPPHVYLHHIRPALASSDQMRSKVWLAGKSSSPEKNCLGVGRHVMLRMRFQRSCQPQAKAAHGPADDGRTPFLVARERGQPADQGIPTKASGACPMSSPESHPFWSCPLDCVHNHLIGFFPATGCPLICSPVPSAFQGSEQAARIVKNLLRGVTAHTEKSLAVG